MQQSPTQGMWGRYALFVVLSFGILAINFYVMSVLAPPRKPQAQEGAKEPGAKEAEGKPAGKPGIAKGKAAVAGEEAVTPLKQALEPLAGKQKPVAAAPAPVPAKAKVPEVKIPDKAVTLGSLDPNSPYRMSVTLTNRGAAVKRIELNSSRFHDLEDRRGYLGHVVIDETARGSGCPVQVVGPGTPAEQAGLEVGDVIRAVDVHDVTDAESLQAALARTKPGQSVTLTVRRNGREHSLSATLARRPLEVVRPEGDAPASFLMTLSQIDDLRLESPEAAGEEKKGDGAPGGPVRELEGVNLRNANWQVVSSDPAHVKFRRELPQWGLEITKTFRLEEVPPEAAGDSTFKAYHLTFDLEIRNTGQKARQVAYQLEGPSGLPKEGSWYASKVIRGGSAGIRDLVVSFSETTPMTIACTEIAGDKYPAPLKREEPLSFVGVDAQYFAAVLIPQKETRFSQWQPVYFRTPDKQLPSLANTSFRLGSIAREIKPKEQLAESFLIFAGPKKPDLLTHYGLRDIVYYGWYGWVAKPLLWIMHAFYWLIPNYGVAIILLTVVVRGCMFPLSRKQALSAQKMQELQPELRKIHEKYKNNLEHRNKAQQELFKKHKFHPMGGCLILFLQLPIFVGLYRALMVDVELRQAPLISEGIRWASNLAAPDMLFDWSRFMPAFVTQGTGLLGLGPYFNLLPIVTIWMFLWQQRMFTPPPADEQARLNQKIMQFMMIFMGILFFKVASGLCIYFIASSLWSLAERKYLPKTAVSSSAAPAERAPKPPTSGPAARDGSGQKRKRSPRK